MRILKNYMVFIICAMVTTTLVTCNDGDGQQSNNDTSTSTSNNDYDHPQFYEEMLQLHNKTRAIHGANPLILNKNISQEAMDYLDKVIDGKVNLTDKYWYYNLYITSNTVQETAVRIFYSMYNDGRDYNYKVESEFKLANSFTQIVWKNTTDVGFAYVYTNKTNYFSAIYKPIGNEKGKYVQNVGEPKLKIERSENRRVGHQRYFFRLYNERQDYDYAKECFVSKTRS